MAIAERYVDDSANGSATAGGSSAGAAKVTGTGWTRDGGAGTKVITLAGSPNLSTVTGSASVGDLVYLASSTGGYNTTWFKVVSVDDANDKLTLHADPGAGNASYAWSIGGAVTFAIAVAIAGSECTAAGDATAVGVRWNVKKQTTGNYDFTTTTQEVLVAGAAGYPLIYRGYNSAIGDLENATRDSTTNLLVTTNFPVITFTTARLYCNAKAFCVFQNLKVTNTGTTNSALHIAGNSYDNNVIECYIGGSGSGNSGYTALTLSANHSVAINCDIINTASTARGGVQTLTAGVSFVYCMFSSENGNGIHHSLRVHVFGCVFYNCTTGIINAASDANSVTTVVNSTFYDCTTIYSGPAVALNSGAIFVNCHCTDSGTGWYSAYDATAQLALTRYKCRTRDITTLDDGFGDWPAISSVTTDGGDATTDYINAAGGDFRLIPAAPGRITGVWNSDCGAMPPVDVSKPLPQIIGA